MATSNSYSNGGHYPDCHTACGIDADVSHSKVYKTQLVALYSQGGYSLLVYIFCV